ncbi:TPA: hypothetical protein ACGTP1_001502 [Salmonella enterica]|nr:hypothetical protein [Salmonella enterica]EEG4168102.1 hypothetical protein [Salmonella enterica]EIP4525407.1 hypothetical protein [Salmonella enterica]EJG3990121.1 hypothetical protein [Salmonella enterica]ELU8733802.1 hypothetical protein [Salmonella enterica]
MKTEKISFIFPSFPSEDEFSSGSTGQPNLAMRVSRFPTELSFLAVAGLVIDDEKEYSLSVDLYFGEDIVTDPEAEMHMVFHKSNLSAEGYYVSTFATPLTATLPAPGIYTLRLSLYENKDGNRLLLDENESQLVVSEGWNL